MIPQADIARWRTQVPWVSAENVEQDLILSRLIVEIAQHPLLGSGLVFRGGTCLHKLWFDRPWRYSEDLDYVRPSTGGVGGILNGVREIAESVGFDDVRTAIGMHHKVRLRARFESGGPFHIKVEINTFEGSPARPAVTKEYVVDSPWFRGVAEIPTFCAPELIATKIRALYQRRKGRDLFDLWLAVNHLGIDPAEIAACFATYRPDGWTVALAIDNLDQKIENPEFVADLAPLVAEWPAGYSIDAGHAVAEAVIHAIEALDGS